MHALYWTSLGVLGLLTGTAAAPFRTDNQSLAWASVVDGTLPCRSCAIEYRGPIAGAQSSKSARYFTVRFEVRDGALFIAGGNQIALVMAPHDMDLVQQRRSQRRAFQFFGLPLEDADRRQMLEGYDDILEIDVNVIKAPLGQDLEGDNLLQEDLAWEVETLARLPDSESESKTSLNAITFAIQRSADGTMTLTYPISTRQNSAIPIFQNGMFAGIATDTWAKLQRFEHEQQDFLSRFRHSLDGILANLGASSSSSVTKHISKHHPMNTFESHRHTHKHHSHHGRPGCSRKIWHKRLHRYYEKLRAFFEAIFSYSSYYIVLMGSLVGYLLLYPLIAGHRSVKDDKRAVRPMEHDEKYERLPLVLNAEQGDDEDEEVVEKS